ncbi:MAG: 3-hydroxyacyl-CoA dehydrogenase/enoyl-CoA hydratase family protein, partial [Candidatus Hydrogenedentes bacterium]|nr:3-hydroxyacyl-CoA dehydrogenase/enoyl-CoA hydratase family protein [Candidatus Hydrogenedentota bacterium]
FFNPPRYMRLLEIIPIADTRPEVVETLADFADRRLGKVVVRAKDTPNFIANRIGTFAMLNTLRLMQEEDLTLEQVDELTGPILGFPRSATFRTADIVGLDTFVHVVANVYNGCPNDEHRDLMVTPDWMKKMVEKGYLGQKTGSGFYKKTDQRDEKGRPVILALDLNTLEYRPQAKTRFDCVGAARNAETIEEKIKAMHTGEDNGSKFLWKLFANTAIYASNRMPEIVDDIVNVDNACKWGFAQERGIYETWDILGVRYVCERMQAEGMTLPAIAQALLESGDGSFYRTDEKGKKLYFDLATKSYKELPQNKNIIVLADLKKAGKVVKENEGCSLVDLGDGIVCAEFHTKMNTIDAVMIQMVQQGVDMLNEGKFAGMVLANQGEHFSAGANIFLVLGEIMQGNWENVDLAIRGFQQVNMAMRFCRRPIVAAPHHYTFGGGIEMAQHCARAVIAGETYGGLVEVGVGIIPAGGGTKEMLRRALAYVPDNVPGAEPFPYVRRAFEAIGMAKVSTSGAELIELGHFTANDAICVSFDQQVKRAKDVCRGLVVAGYNPPKPAVLTALGEPARAVFRSAVYQMRLGGYVSDHDAAIAEELARILTGGDRVPGSKMTEQDVLDLEREAMLKLCGTEKTQQRMQHMLQTGKPLRN